jgi:hypothetical protein
MTRPEMNKEKIRLPRERLLAEVNVPLGLAIADGATKLIRQSTSAASAYTGSTDTLLHLLVDQGLNVGTTREHLNTGRGRVNLLGTARTSDEEQDLQNLAAAWHGQDLCHPCTDPFQVLGRLDDPDECKTAGGDGSVGVTSNDITHVGNLVSDTDTSSP